MITTKGKELISRYLAGRSGTWAGAVELGVAETAVAVGDKSLGFPFVRVPVDYMDYDPENYTVTARATLPDNVAGRFYEIGVFSDEEFPEGEVGHLLLAQFNGQDTAYSGNNSATTVDNVRVGDTAYKLTAPAAGTADLRAFLPGYDLSAYTGSDTINLAYFYEDTGGAPNVELRFESTLGDYFSHTFTPTAGYNIETVERQNLTQTGTPAWSSVSSAYVQLTDQGELTLDGLMIEDTVNIATYGMVVRELLTPELVKGSGVETEITFQVSLGF